MDVRKYWGVINAHPVILRPNGLVNLVKVLISYKELNVSNVIKVVVNA